MENVKFDKIILQIEKINSDLKLKAFQSINQVLTLINWMFGHHIYEYEQGGQDRDLHRSIYPHLNRIFFAEIISMKIKSKLKFFTVKFGRNIFTKRKNIPFFRKP